MQATPQAIQGGSLYSYKTRLGNWQEEIAISEAKLDNFRQRSEAGSLALRQQEVKLNICNEIVPHTFSEDGVIRFGDTIMVEHCGTGTMLACDPFERVIQNTEIYSVTACEQPPQAKARQVFTVLRPPGNLQDKSFDYSGNVLRLGQSFMLGCNESLLARESACILNPQLYLCSTKKNERMATRTTNRQLVYLSPNNNADAIWQFVKPSKGRANGSERFLSMNQPVTNNEPLQLNHRQTALYLTCDSAMKIMSEFGVELECYADRTALNGKLSLMDSEMSGKSTMLTLQKPDSPVYSWNIITASSPEAAIDNRSLPSPASDDGILHELRSQIFIRGVGALWSLRAYFLSLEPQMLGTGKMDREDLKAALAKWGLSMESKFMNPIIEMLKPEKTAGLVEWRRLFALIKGSGMTPMRLDVVTSTFAAMDRDGMGSLDLDTLAYYFSAQSHPLSGMLNDHECLLHLFKMFPKKSGPKASEIISLQEFIEYYSDLSAAVDDDAYFESIVKGTWAGQI